MTTAVPTHSTTVPPEARWRTRDIVVASVIGVAFGVVFWAWGLVWSASDPLFAAIPWAKDLIYGMWFVPAILAPLIIRRPGAALFAEMVAAGVSAMFGTQWGPDVLLSGFVQGAAAEIVFAVTLYRLWNLPVLAVAAVATAAAAWVHDWVLYYAEVAFELQVLRGVMMAISAVVIAAVGSVVLVRALRQAGVLQGFPAGELRG